MTVELICLLNLKSLSIITPRFLAKGRQWESREPMALSMQSKRFCWPNINYFSFILVQKEKVNFHPRQDITEAV